MCHFILILCEKSLFEKKITIRYFGTIVKHGRHSGKAILLEHLSALTHMGEVGQQSDSVSDRSCHHAARTGCTLHFGNSKKHAHSPIPRAAGGFAMVKEKPQNIRIFFCRRKGGGVQTCSAEITQNAISAPIMQRNYDLCC